MKHKGILLSCLLVGLLAVSFGIPSVIGDTCTGKPAYALGETDLPGWTLYNECSLTGWSESLSYGELGETWWQIWINNESWMNADKAMVIFSMDIGIDLGDNIPIIGGTYWDFFLDSITMSSPDIKTVTGTGLDGCVMWNSSLVWIALGYKGTRIIMAGGYGSTSPPSGFLAMAKAPADTGAEEQDVLNLMTAQGGQFGGIPGFSFVPIFITMVVLMSVIFLLKKDQLSLFKTI